MDLVIRVLIRAGQLTGAKIGRERAAQRRSTRCIVAYALDGVVRRTTARHIAAARGACATIIDSVVARRGAAGLRPFRSEEHTSELQSLMRISYAVLCLKKTTITTITHI